MKYIKFILAGCFFGIVLVKSEAISWFRIQEMFYLRSFHMYGLIGSAVITGMISVFIIKKFNIKSWNGESITFIKKPMNKGTVIGGIIFGVGWGITGACPGPLFAQTGYGYLAVLVSIVGALVGTFLFGILKNMLP
jgi:hypothetical protein